MYHLINEPTHFLENSSSCIGLIFTSQPNLVVQSGVHPSLHPNCDHQIVFAFGIIEKQILTLSKEQLATSMGKKPSITLMLIRKYLFSMKQF